MKLLRRGSVDHLVLQGRDFWKEAPRLACSNVPFLALLAPRAICSIIVERRQTSPANLATGSKTISMDKQWDSREENLCFWGVKCPFSAHVYIYIYIFKCFKVSKPLKEILPLSQFQSTVEIHWGLIIVGESVGSAVCFKNPWCQSLIFLGETLISCIVPGNHGLFSGQQKKKILPIMRPPRPPRAPTSLLNAARRPLARLRRTNTHISNMAHHISLEPEPFPLRCNTVCVFFPPFSFLYIFY